jgi:DNA-binding CsgD family transcriptional regulator
MSRTDTIRVGMPLSPREHEVLAAYARIGNYKEVAESLGITERTVKSILERAYGKLGVHNSLAAFYRLGWLSVPDSVNVSRVRAQLEVLRSEVDALLARFRLTWRTA